MVDGWLIFLALQSIYVVDTLLREVAELDELRNETWA